MFRAQPWGIPTANLFPCKVNRVAVKELTVVSVTILGNSVNYNIYPLW